MGRADLSLQVRDNTISNPWSSLASGSGFAPGQGGSPITTTPGQVAAPHPLTGIIGGGDGPRTPETGGPPGLGAFGGFGGFKNAPRAADGPALQPDPPPTPAPAPAPTPTGGAVSVSTDAGGNKVVTDPYKGNTVAAPLTVTNKFPGLSRTGGYTGGVAWVNEYSNTASTNLDHATSSAITAASQLVKSSGKGTQFTIPGYAGTYYMNTQGNFTRVA